MTFFLYYSMLRHTLIDFGKLFLYIIWYFIYKFAYINISLSENDLYFSISHFHLEMGEHSRHCSEKIIDTAHRQFFVEELTVVDIYCF